MQVLKKVVKEKIVKAATDEFFKKGYRYTTIRGIAKKAGVSLGLLYSYYKNKEELFGNIVKPVYTMINDLFKTPDKSNRHKYDNLLIKESALIIDLLKKNRKQFLILVDKSQGTEYENSKDLIVKLTEDHIYRFLSKRISKDKDEAPDNVFYHILANNFIEGLLEIARHYKNEKWASKMVRFLSIQYLYGVEGLTS